MSIRCTSKLKIRMMPSMGALIAAACIIGAAQTVQGQGVAVIPSTNTVGGDETEKQNVRNSFSDQVSLQADTSGTAGVITPVFKQTTGKNFMYVIVPVKKTASSP